MKKSLLIIYIFIIYLYSDTKIDNALKAYENRDYQTAIEIFESKLHEGLESGQLYYNLGNCYFKQGKIARAILNYERAKRLLVEDQDLSANLSIARSQLIDKEEYPEINPIQKWILNFKSLSDIHRIKKIIIAPLCLLVVYFTIFIWYRPKWLKILLIILTTTTGIPLLGGMFLYYKYQEDYLQDLGIIMAERISVMSAPDNNKNTTTLFNLHQGTKIKIIQNNKTWYKISFNDKMTGWIKKNYIEKI